MILLAAALAQRRIREGETAIDGQFAATGAEIPERSTILLDGAPHSVAVRPLAGRYTVELDGECRVASTDWRPGQPCCASQPMARGDDGADRAAARLGVSPRPWRRRPPGAGAARPRAAELLALMPAKQAADTSRLLLSPMPGLLSSLAVAPGQEVKAGEALAIVEAMKMENVLRAERDGRIATIRAKPGDSLAVDEVILEFE